MKFETLGRREAPAILFFHAMGVTGASSEPVAKHLQDRYFCILPTSTVYCAGQKYISKADEVRQVEEFLRKQNVKQIAMVVASSIGADLAMEFLTTTQYPVEHIFFDGGQLYWSKGKTLKKILWCDNDDIKPYFIAAGKVLTYGNMRRQMADSLEDVPFPSLPEELQKHTCFEFGSIEDHYKYRDAVKKAYPYAQFPVWEGQNHMQYQITDPKGFADTLAALIEQGEEHVLG